MAALMLTLSMFVQGSDTTQVAGPPLDVNQMSFDERLQAGRDCFRCDPSLRWTVECTHYSEANLCHPCKLLPSYTKQTREQNFTRDSPELQEERHFTAKFPCNVTGISTACDIGMHIPLNHMVVRHVSHVLVCICRRQYSGTLDSISMQTVCRRQLHMLLRTLITNFQGAVILQGSNWEQADEKAVAICITGQGSGMTCIHHLITVHVSCLSLFHVADLQGSKWKQAMRRLLQG